MAIDHNSYPHLLDQILDSAPLGARLAFRSASRGMRAAVDAACDVEHLVVDHRARGRRLAFRTRGGERIPALSAYESYYDQALGYDSHGQDDNHEDAYSEYVPSDHGGEDSGEDDGESMDEDDDEETQVHRRAKAELDELEACPQCAAFEARLVSQLPGLAENEQRLAQHAADVEDWSRVAEEFPTFRANNDPPQPIDELELIATDDVQEEDHVHELEVANRLFWAELPSTEHRVLEAFATTVSRTRVLDVHGPAMLHDWSAFTHLEMVRYFGGRPGRVPRWVEYDAPTVVRFVDFVPRTREEWGEPKTDAREIRDPTSADNLYQNSLPLRPSYGQVKKWVTSIRYHPAHSAIGRSSLNLVVVFPDTLEEWVAIMVPSTSDPPSDLPAADTDELINNFGPLGDWLRRAVKWNQEVTEIFTPVNAAPKIIVVGLLELGQHALGLGDREWSYVQDWNERDILDRAYGEISVWISHDRTSEQELWDYGRCEVEARRIVKFVSLEDYRREIGEWQYALEVLP